MSSYVVRRADCSTEEHVRLTEQQANLLDLLPDPPTDGRYCKGLVPRNLVRLGLAARTNMRRGAGPGWYYVRTEKGAAVARARREP